MDVKITKNKEMIQGSYNDFRVRIKPDVLYSGFGPDAKVDGVSAIILAYRPGKRNPCYMDYIYEVKHLSSGAQNNILKYNFKKRMEECFVSDDPISLEYQESFNKIIDVITPKINQNFYTMEYWENQEF